MRSVCWKAMVLGSVCLLAVFVAGCTGAPWVDSRREAGAPGKQVGASTMDRIVICHVSDEDSAVLQDMADAQCRRTGRTALFSHTAHWQCSVATPHRSYYKCSGVGSDPEPEAADPDSRE